MTDTDRIGGNARGPLGGLPKIWRHLVCEHGVWLRDWQNQPVFCHACGSATERLGVVPPEWPDTDEERAEHAAAGGLLHDPDDLPTAAITPSWSGSWNDTFTIYTGTYTQADAAWVGTVMVIDRVAGIYRSEGAWHTAGPPV